MLDLASVGPAARASRWLADYGATVVKVGPVPNQQGVQIVPPFYSYSAHRRHAARALRLEGDRGPRRVPAPRRHRRRGDRELPTRRGRPSRRSATRRCRPATRASCTAPRPASGRAARTRNGRATTSTTSASAGSSTAPGRGDDGGPPIPGATIADSAGGGMHAVMAILAALGAAGRRPAPARTSTSSVADGVLATHGARRSTSTSRPARCPSPAPRPPHRAVRVLRQLPDARRQVDHGRRRSSLASGRTSAPRSGSSSGSAHQTDDTVQDEIRADLRAAFLTRDRDDWAAALSAADTCVAPVLSVPEVVDDAQFVARGAFVEAKHPDARHVPAGRARSFAGMTPPAGPYEVRDATVTDTDDAAAGRRAVGRRGARRCATQG